MRTFVMGDIHGAYSAFIECLELCSFDNERDTLIQVGDVVDGGTEVFECVESLLTIKNLIALRGNHDDWFLDFINTGHHPGQWQFGGEGTILSYAKRVGKERLIAKTGNGIKTGLTPEDIPERHRQFLDNQRLYYIDDQNRLFVHAGFDRRVSFFDQHPQNYFWDRDLWMQALDWQNENVGVQDPEPFEMITEFKEIFIGHTQTTYWNVSVPMRAANIMNIDTGSRHGGKLTIMDVETKEFWQSR